MTNITFKNSDKKLDLVILVGGKGTRIKKYLNGLPKPMLKFNNKHFLNYIINFTIKYNLNKIYLLTGYKSSIIFKKFHNKTFNFVKIKCIKEGKDRYKRILAECFVNNESLSRYLVRSGYAFAYRKYSKKFIIDEDYARTNKLGMWSMEFEYPWDFRKNN